jgi:hypothetical protein
MPLVGVRFIKVVKRIRNNEQLKTIQRLLCERLTIYDGPIAIVHQQIGKWFITTQGVKVVVRFIKHHARCVFSERGIGDVDFEI